MKKFINQVLILLIGLAVLGSCNKSKEKLNVEEPKKQEEPQPTENVWKVDGIDMIRTINLTTNYTVASGATLPATFADTVKKTRELLIKVFSSKEFRDELYKRNFHDSAYSKNKSTCFKRVYGGTIKGRSIAGKSVYDNLLPNNTFSMSANIRKNGTNIRTLGSASACGSRITTNDWWLKLSEQRLAYRLARHWAHEYTHIKGYRHDSNVPTSYKWGDNVDLDPAYGVGDVVGIVLERWEKAGLIE